MFKFTDFIIIKVSMDCNLSCTYCFMRDQEQKEIKFETYTKIIDQIVQQRITQKREAMPLVLVFHGGEILMLSPEYLDKLLNYAETEFKKHNLKRVTYGTQTNFTLFNEEYAKVFCKYPFNVGISYDGPGELNSLRITDFSLEDKIDLLKKYKISFSFITTLSKNNINCMSELCSYLKSFNPDKFSGKMNYVEDIDHPGPDSKLEINGKDLFEKSFKFEVEELIKNKREIINQNTSDLLYKTITDIVCYIKRTTHTGCGSKYCGGGMHMVIINIDGSADTCDRRDKHIPGSYIQEATDYDFLGINQLNKSIQDNVKKQKVYEEMGCNACEAEYICDYGCMSLHYTKYGKYGIKEYLTCNYYKPVYKYVYDNLENIFNVCNIITGFDVLLAVKPEIINKFKDKFAFQILNNKLLIGKK